MSNSEDELMAPKSPMSNSISVPTALPNVSSMGVKMSGPGIVPSFLLIRGGRTTGGGFRGGGADGGCITWSRGVIGSCGVSERGVLAVLELREPG